MAEVVVIGEYNGSPKVFTSLANKIARFNTADVAEPGLSNPCKIPVAPNVYHPFRKSFGAHISGDFNQVTNLTTNGDGNFANDWGMDANNGGKVVIGARDTGDNGCPLDEYAVATGQVGVTGHSIGDPVNGHPYYKSQSLPTKDFDTCTPNAPLLIDAGPYTAEFYSKIWVMSADIVATSAYGAKSPKAITLGYTIF